MGSVIQVIPQRLQGTFQSATFSVPAGAVTPFEIKLTSPTFPTDATMSIGYLAERSFDAGASWTGWFATPPGGSMGGLQGQPVGKFGAIYDGLPAQRVVFDGVACQARITITPAVSGVDNTPFVWGMTAQVL